MTSFLDQYEPLDIIGNGSFGIIRKVRRKADGMVFARKELNFERMTERDRKQIVAEVNILKELNHEHIVRYHDRYVDRDAGILYILMEYCGGGDLSTVIKQAAKTGRPIPEDTIWNYFMQILLALHHCHHPNSHARNGSAGLGDEVGNGLVPGTGAKERRAQILHRDLKPDNVFLDENNAVKLGDFGLSKALPQSSFANTYVGTPYYMSPELMQERAYDTKSDIWSLGCLIYELCALKPPFHEAKTHSELNMCIRNGRIPPLPRGYSQALSGAIKAMLNLNPAIRPSAIQLLQHERLELSFQVSETDKLLSQVKSHRSAVLAKEREVLAREETLKDRERRVNSILADKDTEIGRLQAHISHIQQHPQITQRDVEFAIRRAVACREDELRVLIQQREEEVANAMAKREEEIMEAVRRHETEVCRTWSAREAEIRQEVEVSLKAVQERMERIVQKEEDLKAEGKKVEEMREEVEERMRLWEVSQKGKIHKAPLEEVKNILEPIHRIALETPTQRRPQYTTKYTTVSTTANTHKTPKPSDTNDKLIPGLQTPIMRPNCTDTLPSAMKGVVLTATGETLATPSPTELAKLFNQSPRVGLGFTKIFESDPLLPGTRSSGESGLRNERRLSTDSTESEDADSPPPSPSARKEQERKEKDKERDRTELSASSTAISASASASNPKPATSSSTSSTSKSVPGPSSTTAKPSKPISRQKSSHLQSQPQQHSSSATSTETTKSVPAPVPVPVTRSYSHLPPAPVYDLADEENLPSPFLKKVDKEVKGGSTATTTKKRPSTSGGNYLRAMAAAIVVNGKRAASVMGISPSSRAVTSEDENVNGEAVVTRLALVSARKATEEARKKPLSRP
ncbi:G2-specific protein kinase nim-1 [Leucoagaricus sp. SymC.cos]|nr:G2-specific protein kinase nim-1 [Leucoagaricus sp. SymC.cos]